MHGRVPHTAERFFPCMVGTAYGWALLPIHGVDPHTAGCFPPCMGLPHTAGCFPLCMVGPAHSGALLPMHGATAHAGAFPPMHGCPPQNKRILVLREIRCRVAEQFHKLYLGLVAALQVQNLAVLVVDKA